MKKQKVGVLGAWAIKNPGDNLLGLATRLAVEKHCPNVEVVLMSPNPKEDYRDRDFSALHGLGREIRPIGDLQGVGWADELDALIIGGGGIAIPSDDRRLFFLNDPQNWKSDICPASWNGVGSQGASWFRKDFRGRKDLVRSCCEKLSYISVRNHTTEKFLRQSGFDGEIHRVPDPSILLDFPENSLLSQKLQAMGCDKDKFLIGISLGKEFETSSYQAFYKDLFETLAMIANRNSSVMEIVAFPFSEMYGERHVAESLCQNIPGSKCFSELLSPIDAWQMVGKMDFFIGGRFHSMLAAFTQNVPFFVVDPYLSPYTLTSKIRSFLVDHDLELLYSSPSFPRTPSEKLMILFDLVQSGGWDNTALVASLRDKLEDHYQNMFHSLGLKK